jgi:hypothetical protein
LHLSTLSPEFSEAEAASWYDGKSFTSDWTSWHFPVWTKALAPLRAREARVLEIGSWEGRSALFFLNYLPRCRLTCIDPWTGNVEHLLDPYFAAFVPESERRFDANVAAFADRIEKIKAPSPRALPELGVAGRRFDAVYIDGSHIAADVYGDGALSWPMVVPGGIVIFDDYEWPGFEDPRQLPRHGIDAFLSVFAGQYHMIEHGYQILISKV